MKKVTTYLILSLAAFLFAGPVIQGQGRFGADSAECVKHLSIYQQYMKQGNMKEAAPSWRKAIAICPPQSSQSMLLDGMKILRKEISQYASNPVRKKDLIDSLMMLHNLRMENFPKYQVQAKINQALDMISYYRDEEKMSQLCEALCGAMDVAKDKTPVAVPVKYMEFTCALYKNGKLSAEDVMSNFQKASEVLTLIEQAKPSNEVKSAQKDIETLFSQSGVASCENLVSLLQPRYDADPTNKELLASIVNTFSAQGCLEEDLFRNAVEGLHQIEPTFNSAYFLYKLYSNAGDNNKAISYMNEAIAYPESDDAKDAEFNYELATFYYKKIGNLTEAVKYAKASVGLSSDFAGKAYFLIGTVWGALKCEGNDIEIRAPYWVAVDYMIKAKNADPALAEEANGLIASYSKYFPMQEDAFMFDVIDGTSYTVSCSGMREVTKVRTQK